jgi:hypothetical protein
MQASANPYYFDPATGYTVRVIGGTPPYTVTALPSPPNPEGVEVDPGPPVKVTCPPGTPAGTVVQVEVTDSSTPTPQACPASGRVQ